MEFIRKIVKLMLRNIQRSDNLKQFFKKLDQKKQKTVQINKS